MRTTLTLLPALASLCLVSACASLDFQHVQVLEQGFDDGTQSYRLLLQFELLDGDGLPVQYEDEPSFRVTEDDVSSTSESIRLVEQVRVLRPIVLLLDTSLSMSDEIPALRAAASAFVEKLRGQGFEQIDAYRFARTVSKIDDVRDLEASFASSPAERWTSLYHAVHEMLNLHPESVLVVFSDGADNYSQNHGVGGLKELTDRIEEGGYQVHAIGCGAVRDERDRDGTSGARALRRIAQNGTYRYVESADGLDDVFDFIARRMQSIFTLEYYSPNLSGEHELVLGAEVGRAHGASDPIPFSAAR